jgi:hypothetical protein
VPQVTQASLYSRFISQLFSQQPAPVENKRRNVKPLPTSSDRIDLVCEYAKNRNFKALSTYLKANRVDLKQTNSDGLTVFEKMADFSMDNQEYHKIINLLILYGAPLLGVDSNQYTSGMDRAHTFGDDLWRASYLLMSGQRPTNESYSSTNPILREALAARTQLANELGLRDVSHNVSPPVQQQASYSYNHNSHADDDLGGFPSYYNH